MMAAVAVSGAVVCVAKPGLGYETLRRGSSFKESATGTASPSRIADRGDGIRLRTAGDRRANCCTRFNKVRALLDAGAQQITSDGGLAEDNKSISDFLRFCDNGDQGSELQTAIITYTKPFPWRIFQRQQVDLVSAVHIADKQYFDQLQDELGTYDRVLFEMVADKSSEQKSRTMRSRWRPPKPGIKRSGFSVIGAIQQGIAYVLGLDFQLECMDYRRDNWFHADMDYETFQGLQKERGETFLSFARDMSLASSKAIMSATLPSYLDPFRAKLLWVSRVMPMPLVGLFVIEGVCAPSGAPLNKSPEMKALLDLDLAVALKVFLAKRISIDLADGTTSLMERSVIIGERNKIAMQELQEALRAGCQKIAVFYGSGHLPDMDQRLRKDFGLEASHISWRTAWSMKTRTKATKPDSISMALKVLQEASGWPLDRYQTLGVILFSAILAVDLWFWEIFLGAMNEYVESVVSAIVQFLDRGWTL